MSCPEVCECWKPLCKARFASRLASTRAALAEKDWNEARSYLANAQARYDRLTALTMDLQNQEQRAWNKVRDLEAGS